MNSMTKAGFHRLIGMATWLALAGGLAAQRAGVGAAASSKFSTSELLGKYCLDCHDADAKKGALNLDAVLRQEINQHPEVWERVVRRLNTRQMPPAKKNPRPTEAEYEAVIASLAGIQSRRALKLALK